MKPGHKIKRMKFGISHFDPFLGFRDSLVSTASQTKHNNEASLVPVNRPPGGSVVAPVPLNKPPGDSVGAPVLLNEPPEGSVGAPVPLNRPPGGSVDASTLSILDQNLTLNTSTSYASDQNMLACHTMKHHSAQNIPRHENQDSAKRINVDPANNRQPSMLPASMRGQKVTHHECPLCNQLFITPELLIIHIKYKHGNMDTKFSTACDSLYMVV